MSDDLSPLAGVTAATDPQRRGLFAGFARRIAAHDVTYVSFGCNLEKFLSGPEDAIGQADSWWCTGRYRLGTVTIRTTGRSGEEAFRALADRLDAGDTSE